MPLADGDKFFLSLKCTKFKYAKDMYEYGSIYFGCAESWAQIGKKGNKGQGDINEGVFAKLEITDIIKLEKFKVKYGSNLEIRRDGNFNYLKLKNISLLPAFCLYTLKHKYLDIEERAGIQKVRYDITPQIFIDFADGMTSKQIEALPRDEQPAFIAITNFDKFRNRLTTELLRQGAVINEIIPKHVEYVDRTACFEMNDHPFELFIKDKEYEYQGETRFVINSDRLRLTDYNKGLTLKIGSMKDYAQIVEGYHYMGLRLECNVDVYEIEEDN